MLALVLIVLCLSEAKPSKPSQPLTLRDPSTTSDVAPIYQLDPTYKTLPKITGVQTPRATIQERYVEASKLYNAAVGHAKDNVEKAVVLLLQAAHKCPEMPMVWNNLAAFALSAQFFDAARIYAERAVAIEPEVMYLSNLGRSLCLLKKHAEGTMVLSRISYTCDGGVVGDLIRCEAGKYNKTTYKALELCLLQKPIRTELLLSVHDYVATSQGTPAYLALLDKVFKAHYDDASTLSLLFSVAYHRFEFRVAQKIALRGVELNPNDIELLYGAAAASSALMDRVEATELYARVMQKGNATNPRVYNLALIETVNHHQLLCNWKQYQYNFLIMKELILRQVSEGRAPSQIPFSTIGYPYTSAEILSVASMTVKTTCAEVQKGVLDVQTPENRKKVFVGIITGDAGSTNVGRDIVGWFRHAKQVAKDDLRLILISTRDHGDDDTWSKLIRKEAGKENVVDLPLYGSDDDIAAIIRKLKLDVLINLNGYSKYNKNPVFCRDVAPVTINYKGSAMTFGGDGKVMNYVIGDKCVIPGATLQPHYAEKIIHMPRSFFLTSYPDVWPHVISETTELPFVKPKGVSIVLCNFNHLNKVTPWTYRVWMNIMRRLKGKAVLWMLRLSGHAEPFLMDEAAAAGIPSSHIVFTHLFTDRDHMVVKKHCDLFLDTDIFNAHGTATDVLWSGVPILTLPGEPYHSRVAACHISSLDIQSIPIPKTWHEYETVGVAIASNRTALIEARKEVGIRRMEADLFNTPQWVSDFAAVMKIVKRLQRAGFESMHIVGVQTKKIQTTVSDLVKAKYEKWHNHKH